MVRLFAFVVWAAIIGAAAFPPEMVLRSERGIGAVLLKFERYDAAQRVYWWLAFRGDPIGVNNWHVVEAYLSTDKSHDIRVDVIKGAGKAWRYAGKQRVGAAYWNLAMLNARYKRDSEKRDRAATRYLQNAQRFGVVEAKPVLNAGPGKFDRIETLMKLGDAGAADSFALQMHYANNTEAKDAALSLAAAAGEANAMDELGWSLINRRNADMTLAEYWLVKAAKAGQSAAMMRLGRCYRDAVYFCDAVDVKKAEYWFSRAAVTDFRRTYPSIWVDDNLALRIGIMPTSYYAGNGQRERARRVLERMRDLQ